MIASPRPLDCAPLAPGDAARLTDAELLRIEPVQRALLSPFEHDSIGSWRRAVNRELVAAFDSDAALFQLDIEGEPLHFSEEFDEADLGRYQADVMPRVADQRKLYRRGVIAKAGNRSIIWGRHLEWLYRSDYFNELVLPMRAYDPLWAAAAAPEGTYPTLIHTYHDRRNTRRFFEAKHVAMMRLVQPALEAGVRALKRMAARRVALVRSLEATHGAVIVLDHEGRVLHRTPSVERMTVDRVGERLVLDAARAMVAGLASDDLAVRLAPGNVVRHLETRAGELELTAVEIAEGALATRPVAVVTLTASREAPLPDSQTLRERFSLTRRQVEVARLLAERKSNPEMAEALCISEHTVRSHVEAVMGKVGVSDRREIAARLRSGSSSP